MKKIIITIILITSFSFASNAQFASNTQEELKIDITKSELKWFGEYTFYFGGHEGTIQFKEGHFIKTNHKITGGEFVIDMNSIINIDIEKGEANTDLVNHLKNSDFFDVKNFPTSKLVITKVTYHDATHMKIYADFTIKGITLPIDFQAEVDFKKEQLTTKFKIDRMRWGINYNSKLKNSAISDAIGFIIELSL